MGSNTLEHIAIIMDGNGRWAKQRQLDHNDGHRAGAKSVRTVIELSQKYGIKYLTLYAFSTENWNRPKKEVLGLMSLLGEFIDENIETIKEKQIQLKVIGELEKIPLLTRNKLKKAIKDTNNNKNGTLVLALSYGGRTEIVDAVKKIANDVKLDKIKSKDIDDELFRSYLYEPSIPDPDLLIRTSGELRISNFLLWQLSYSEIYVTDTLWPDFNEEEFKKAIDAYRSRKRRYGKR
jgi:undecaprenyl diphosphate synthase